MIKYDSKVDEGGHIKMKLFEKENRGWRESVWKDNKDQSDKIARKLHRQFAHPSKEKLKKLISEG